MIAIVLLLAAATLIAIPGLVGQPVRLSGRAWSCAVAAALMVGLALLIIGLATFALPTMLASFHAVGLADFCEALPVPLAPGGPVLGWTAFIVAVAIFGRAIRAGRRVVREARAAEVEPWLGWHEDRGEFELVVVPTDAPIAMSVPVEPPQIVISSGLVACLGPRELDVVVQHEVTHHRFGHWRFSALAAAIDRGLQPMPLVSRSTWTLRNALEHWADEGAAGTSTERRADVRHALVTVANPLQGAPTPGSPGLRGRIERLECPSVPVSGLGAVAAAPAIVLGPPAVLTVAVWSVFAHHMAALIGSCPH